MKENFQERIGYTGRYREHLLRVPGIPCIAIGNTWNTRHRAQCSRLCDKILRNINVLATWNTMNTENTGKTVRPEKMR